MIVNLRHKKPNRPWKSRKSLLGRPAIWIDSSSNMTSTYKKTPLQRHNAALARINENGGSEEEAGDGYGRDGLIVRKATAAKFFRVRPQGAVALGMKKKQLRVGVVGSRHGVFLFFFSRGGDN